MGYHVFLETLKPHVFYMSSCITSKVADMQLKLTIRLTNTYLATAISFRKF